MQRELLRQFVNLQPIEGSERVCMRYDICLGDHKTGFKALIKKTSRTYRIELGFEFTYHGGSWQIHKPFALWKGTTYQAPEQIDLGFNRAGQLTWFMGPGGNKPKECRDIIVDFITDTRWNWVMANALAHKINYTISLAHALGGMNDLLSPLWGEQDE